MKKLKVLFAAIVFLLIVLACSQVNAGTLHTVLEVATFLNNGGGQVEVQGGTIILHHDVALTEDIYVYDENKTAMTIDLNGHYIDFNFSADPGVAAIWANNAGNLTIIDSTKGGKSYIRTNRDSLISWNTSTLTVENVNLIGTYSSTEPLINSCKVNTTYLKNLEISSYKGGIATQQNVDYYLDNVTFKLGDSNCEYGIKVYGYSQVVLNNCKYSSTVGAGNLVWIDTTTNNAKVTINGGTYNYEGSGSTNYLLRVENGILEINDGSFKSQNTEVMHIFGGNVTINNGVFDGRENAISAVKDSTLTIKGGWFKCRPQSVGDDKGAIAFSSSKTLADIMPAGYFMTDETITKNNVSQYNETAMDVNVYAKPASITFDKTELPYSGKYQTPTATVKDTNGNKLQYGTDFLVQYQTSSKEVGNYTAKVVFIDRYGSMPSKELTYKIVKADFDMSKVKFEDKKLTYNGKKQKIKVTGLPAGVTVSYKNNKKKDIGEYKVTAIFTLADTKNYNPIPNKTAKMTIAPKGTSLNKLTAGKKQFKATWKKQTKQTSGYELQYSTDKSFNSGSKKVKIKKNKTTSTTVKKLKGKKKYYVRIRTYKSVNGKKIYSKWSSSKKVTTKK